MRRIVGVVLCICSGIAQAQSAEECVATTYGKCFSIHARYAVYTGHGMEVLWPVGTHRLLLAASATGELDTLLQGHLDDSYVFGDFVVCPLTKEFPGEMRHVCIQKMAHLRRAMREPSGR